MATVLQLNPIPAAQDSPEQEPQESVQEPTTHPLQAIVAQALGAEKPNMEQITTIYLKLRDAKKELEAKAKAKGAPINQGMTDIENFFLAKMNELGVDSLKNGAGTPYKAERVSITMADNSAFVDYVLDRALQALPLSDTARTAIVRAIADSGQMALIEARASKTAVEELLEQTGELPPGLNRTAAYTVNVRKD